jgi:plasmid stability protein
MATLYVENVPDDLYEALRERARSKRSSIATEVISLIRENVPTGDELKRRLKFLRQMQKLSSQKPLSEGFFPSAEERIREDREG